MFEIAYTVRRGNIRCRQQDGVSIDGVTHRVSVC